MEEEYYDELGNISDDNRDVEDGGTGNIEVEDEHSDNKDDTLSEKIRRQQRLELLHQQRLHQVNH